MSVVEQAQRLITEAVEAALEETYHLVHIHQGDELSRDQADGLVDNDDVDWDDWEWIYDVQRDGAEWELNEILRCVETALWRGHPEFEWDLHIADWREGPQWGECFFTIVERDVSNPIRDLAGQTQVALRIPLPEPDDLRADPREVLTQMGIEPSEPNVAALREVLTEWGGDYGWPFLLVYVNAGDVYDLGFDDDTLVEVTDGHLFITNVYAGDGHTAKVEGPVRVRRGELRTDTSAAGWGWGEIAGPVWSFYSGSIVRVEEV